jgi:hypothetical protein
MNRQSQRREDFPVAAIRIAPKAGALMVAGLPLGRLKNGLEFDPQSAATDRSLTQINHATKMGC